MFFAVFHTFSRTMVEMVRLTRHKKTTPLRPIATHFLSETHCAISL